MIDTEQRLQRGLHAYADAVAVTPPPVSDVLEGTRQVSPPRRSRIWVAALAAGAVAVGGVATATDIIPSPVRDMFNEFRGYDEWNFDTDLEELRQVATVDTADGGRVEVWFAPTESGGACLYERLVGRDGVDRTRGAAHCSEAPLREADGSPQLYHWGGDDRLLGQAPQEAVAVNVDVSDGTRQTAVPQVDGWYIVMFDRPLSLDAQSVSVTAVSADGEVLAFQAIRMSDRTRVP